MTTRKVKDVAFYCGIPSVLKTADNWAAMVTIMNRDDKKYDVISKEMAALQKADPTVLKMPTCLACNKAS